MVSQILSLSLFFFKYYTLTLLSLLPGTIISMQENPFPGPYTPTAEEERTVIEAVRRNIVSIFSGVSKQYSADSERESLVTVRVRHFSDSEPDQASIKQEDGPSLLLYYIFDDWISSYRLVARREHMYGAILDDLVSLARGREHYCTVSMLTDA